jgi:hypothetical protein
MMNVKSIDRESLLMLGSGILEENGIRVSHFIPGRLRLKASAIKGNPPLAQKITELFLVIQGINLVEANHLTGSLLIEYNAAELKSRDSSRSLGEALRFLATQLDHEKVSILLQWL